MTPSARALAEAVLKECADPDSPCSDVERCGCAESLALAFLAALSTTDVERVTRAFNAARPDAEPQRLDREALDFGEGFYVCVKCWKVSPVPRVCFCRCNVNDGWTIVEVTKASILARLEADRG